MELTATFETGKTYEMRFIGDYELRPRFKCVKRSAKMATFVSEYDGEVLRRKINTNGGYEAVNQGNYSMAPGISAEDLVNPF